MSPLLDTEWRLWTPPSADTPAHIYAGVRLVATVFDYDVARRMVAEHNSRLLIERGRDVPDAPADETAALLKAAKDDFERINALPDDERRRAAAMYLRSGGPVTNHVCHFEPVGEPVLSEYQEGMVSGVRQCKHCGAVQHYTAMREDS